jgi:hypothetical protein
MFYRINVVLTIVNRQNSSNATNKSSCTGKSMERSIGRIAPFFFFFLLFATLFPLRYLLLLQGHWASEFCCLLERYESYGTKANVYFRLSFSPRASISSHVPKYHPCAALSIRGVELLLSLIADTSEKIVISENERQVCGSLPSLPSSSKITEFR